MSVKAINLDNQERDMNLITRENGEEKPKREDHAATLRAMRERIAAAKAIRPDGAHCRDCFEQGRNAALRAIEGG
jgi:hypothetical protein